MTTDPNPSAPSPAARAADPIGDLSARVRELEAQVAELSDTRRRSYFGLHHPMDAQESTYPPRFDPPVIVDGEPLPLPPPSVRAGYAPNDDALYLRWGKFDHDFILSIAGRYLELQNPLGILDFGCSSGRVLRHFETERQSAGWRPHGVDAQAMLIEWMRSFWPPAYDVSTANVVLPVLPFEDNYFDVIFGISVFTHIKYLWDGWLCELRRCLKPGGLCLQTVHCEEAWSLYARGDAEWQVAGVPDHVRQHPAMDVDYLLFNKSTTSNTFFRRSVVAKLFGRYMAVREVLDPPEFSFQHWVVMQKEGLRTDLAADKLAPMRGIAGQPDPPMPGPAPGPPTAELDPDRHAEAELTRRIEYICRGLTNEETERIGMARVGAEIRAILDDPLFEQWPIDKQLPMVQRTAEIYFGNHHASGRSLIPALERVFHRALAAPGVALDTLCLFHDFFYFLYWYTAPNWDAMRGVAGVMTPVAAAIRSGAVRGLPAIAPRPLGREPLRLGYLAQFVLLGNPIGRGVGDLLDGLSRYLPGTYQLVLYAWSEYDDALIAVLADQGITVRRFTANSMSERVSAVAEAIAADEIDILITDMNSALPTVLFERRTAPVQIFFQNGLPFWPLANIHGVFRIEFYDPKLDGFDPDICFNLGLGAWTQRQYEYAPPVEPARIATERARFPPAVTLAGIYGRLAKITPDFLEIIAELLARHPQLVVLLGGTGDGKWIGDFIAERGLAGRLVLVDEYVDGHVWGHMLDIFLDTSVDVTVAGREIMAKGKPIVSMRTPTHEHERAPMLIADSRAIYIDLVSRLIEDHDFYEAACAATRDFVAAQPGEREYIAAVHDALSTTVSRVRTRALSTKTARNLTLDRLVYSSVLDELRSSAPSRIAQVDFGPGGKPVEIGAAGEVLYLPALHLQLWRDTVVPREANFDADAFDELQANISSSAVQFTEPLDDIDEIDDEVCILSNLYSNNFFHSFEELYKATILERGGFRGRYVLSPFGDRHFPGLPPFATGFLELLGIRDDRIIICRRPTVFQSSWLTTRIGCEDTIAYSNVFLALRSALITAATTIAPSLGPRLYLERYPKRVVVNREEVRDCVSRYGFTTVDMATLPVAQQIAAAHHADVLLGTHGSGMLHCAFQKNKSTVIECFSPYFMDFFILDILHILDHRYLQIVAMDRTAPVGYDHGVDVAIDCHHLELVLKQLPYGG